MSIPVHLVSVDDLTDTLTRIAEIAKTAFAQIDETEPRVNGKKALYRIRWEALDALDRAGQEETP